MKTLLFIFMLLTALFGIAQSDYIRAIEEERTRYTEEMANEILDSSEAAGFRGICYFPVDTNYIVTATFRRKKGKKFAMPMTKERTVYYRQYGLLEFTLHDTLCVLPIYENLDLKGQSAYQDYLFLPFRDGTTAVSTYGGGRYLDVRKPKNNIWQLDFNKAYHPYCLYSHRYSCPVPPPQNTIAPFILAGECYDPGNHDE